MNESAITQKLTELGYHGAKEAYTRQCETPAMQSLSFEERLFELLDAQILFLKNKRIAMNTKLSKIKDKQAALSQIVYHPQRRLNREQIAALASLDFIRHYQNIIITGKTGTGKSYLAQAFANRAIEGGYKAYYVRMPSLLEEIRVARIDGTYTRLLKKYSRFALLILDDFGIAPITADDATNLFEIIEERTNINSTIITSQLPVSEWYDYLSNNTVADAILDRIVYSSHRIKMKGESMRKRQKVDTIGVD
jgi:DNA replication protein DnaC